MTVTDNTGFARRLAGRSKVERRKVVEEAARILQIEHLLDRKPAQLSGGQRQRVAIGRYIVRQPDVFLFVESLPNLDVELRVQIRVEIARQYQTLDTTMIYVTHDQTEAITLADRIVVLCGGIIEQVGAPTDLYDDPDNAFVAGFIGSSAMNFLPCVAASENAVEDAGLTIPVPQLTTKLEVGETQKFGIRPEYLNGTTGPSVEMKIEVVEQMGATAFVHGNLGPELPLLVEARATRTKSGDSISVPFDPRFIYLFNAGGARVR